ncbi:uncharacterized protein LOC125093616 [Lutra lutra]|uniref:uncharacterized protein LOC125093616 n=1 Tax=Lutra lutra TaxID=9657 RepID=UPI001FD3420E|nr:uncharacterized protein LOC125093616 [Lutra lutra]
MGAWRRQPSSGAQHCGRPGGSRPSSPGPRTSDRLCGADARNPTSNNADLQEGRGEESPRPRVAPSLPWALFPSVFLPLRPAQSVLTGERPSSALTRDGAHSLLGVRALVTLLPFRQSLCGSRSDRPRGSRSPDPGRKALLRRRGVRPLRSRRRPGIGPESAPENVCVFLRARSHQTCGSPPRRFLPISAFRSLRGSLRGLRRSGFRRGEGRERGEAADGRRARASHGHLRGAPGPLAPIRVYEHKSQTSRKE